MNVALRYDESGHVDLDKLSHLLKAVGWDHRIKDRARLAQMVEGSCFVVAAYEGDELVGFARAISDGVFNAYISTVAVLPRSQRRGVGSEMIRRLLHDRDGITFALHAPEAGRFYERFGFKASPHLYRRERR